MKKNPERIDTRNLNVRMQDLEMKLDHALFLLGEYRRMRLCDRCGEDVDDDGAAAEYSIGTVR